MAKKEYTYEEICRDIIAKKFAPVYILMGEEPFFMDQITDLLIEHVLDESERDFNQIIMYGADTDSISIINAARRFPMMSKYQLIVVREAQLIRDIEVLSNYVKNPLMSTVLVINYKYKNLDKRKSLSVNTFSKFTVVKSSFAKMSYTFSKKLIPDTNLEILGVRVPKIKAIAKKFTNTNHAIEFLSCDHKYYEEWFLHGFL